MAKKKPKKKVKPEKKVVVAKENSPITDKKDASSQKEQISSSSPDKKHNKPKDPRLLKYLVLGSVMIMILIPFILFWDQILSAVIADPFILVYVVVGIALALITYFIPDIMQRLREKKQQLRKDKAAHEEMQKSLSKNKPALQVKDKLPFFKRLFTPKEKPISAQKRRELVRESERKEYERKHLLKVYLLKAGVRFDQHMISRSIFNFAILLNIIISVYLLYFFATTKEYSLFTVIMTMIGLWLVIFFVLLFLLWLVFFIFLDLKTFHRKLSIEEVLPDYLQLTSANIRAGMPIDKALWYAVRPRFGVLANEIEIVAKETTAGMDLETALINFTNKYDSDILKRSILLLIEGIHAGGEVGDLLNKISSNIQESRIMRKEMAANVTTYTIFISFATVLAAPALFALSYQLLTIIQTISASIDIPSAGGRGFASGLVFQSLAILPSDFNMFAMFSLTMTATFSAMIIATIKKGNIKEGAKYIPTFIFVSLILYLVFRNILSGFLAGFF